eukprot:852062_1
MTLRNKYTIKNNNENDNKQNDENKEHIPSKFICPITKKIMINPVVAFDGNIYGKDAILKHLKEKGTSPITGEEAYTLHVFSKKLLKKEIQTYLALYTINVDEGDSNVMG